MEGACDGWGWGNQWLCLLKPWMKFHLHHKIYLLKTYELQILSFFILKEWTVLVELHCAMCLTRKLANLSIHLGTPIVNAASWSIYPMDMSTYFANSACWLTGYVEEMLCSSPEEFLQFKLAVVNLCLYQKMAPLLVSSRKSLNRVMDDCHIQTLTVP